MIVEKIKSYLIHDAQGIIIFFVLKLFIYFFLFDYFFQFLIGASIEGGIYLSVLENYNLAEMYRDFLLQVSGYIVRISGYNYIIQEKYLIISGGGGISLGYSCYGFSVISAYIGLILAYPKKGTIKTLFLIFGVFLIIILNILRISILTIVYSEKSHVLDLDHHLIFNIVVYSFIFIIFYLYVNIKKSNIKV